MKKVWAALSSSLVAVVMLGTIPAHASVSSPLTVQVNGVPTPSGTHVVHDQVMVPIRWAAEQLDARSIKWDLTTRDIFIQTADVTDKIAKLSSYACGLETREASKEAEMWPLTENAKKALLSLQGQHLFHRDLILDFRDSPLEKRGISITVNRENNSYAVYSAENHNGHVYLPMDWLEQLFWADVQYNKEANQLFIQAPNQAEIEKRIAAVEDALVASTPQEAMQLWGRGEQTRSGALQYAVLSPELRKKVEERVREQGWTTGGSSPWVGPITVKEEKKRSETSVEYTVTYPEVTSAGSAVGTEKFVVEKLSVDGKEGWFITRLLYASPYYSIIQAETLAPEAEIRWSEFTK